MEDNVQIYSEYTWTNPLTSR